MAKEPIIYLSQLEINKKNFIFFKDNDLVINAIQTRDTNNKLVSIEFIPDSAENSFVNFEIINIHPCTTELGLKFYMVHFYVATDAADKLPFVAYTNSHLQNINLNDRNDKEIFLYNLHKRRPNSEINCVFNTTQPKTKDGSIIVSI